MPLTAANILVEMRANPLNFLRHYKLTIAGGARGGASGVKTFLFTDQNQTHSGFTTGLSGLLGLTKNRPALRFTKLVAYNPNPDINQDHFNAHYVAMDTDGGPITTYAVPTNGPTDDQNPDIMLTSQLSNCTFGIGSVALGAQLLCHIEPNVGGGFNRNHLHQSVTGLLHQGVDSIFERENQNNVTGYGNLNNRTTVIGIRTGTTWRYYAQSGGDLQHGNTVLSVRALN